MKLRDALVNIQICNSGIDTVLVCKGCGTALYGWDYNDDTLRDAVEYALLHLKESHSQFIEE